MRNTYRRSPCWLDPFAGPGADADAAAAAGAA